MPKPYTLHKPRAQGYLHATLQVMFQNRTGKLALVDLYYEWGRGRNANLIHAQQGSTLYDIGAAPGSDAKHTCSV